MGFYPHGGEGAESGSTPESERFIEKVIRVKLAEQAFNATALRAGEIAELQHELESKRKDRKRRRHV
eukprot:3892969-Pleurochrysis_carterae.AAC.1